MHRPDALRIFEFAHAAQGCSLIAQACQQASKPLASDWASKQCHGLKPEGPEAALAQLEHLAPVETVQEHVRYVSKRVAHMQYPAYQAAGWPIGSGGVESANKVVMQARLKRTGMRWAPNHVNAMLA